MLVGLVVLTGLARSAARYSIAVIPGRKKYPPPSSRVNCGSPRDFRRTGSAGQVSWSSGLGCGARRRPPMIGSPSEVSPPNTGDFTHATGASGLRRRFFGGVSDR